MNCPEVLTGAPLVDRLPLFAGPFDVGHALLGVAAGISPVERSALIALGFLLYESFRAKPLSRKVAAGTQFMVGYLSAKAVA